MLTCREVIEFLDDYVAGILSPARIAEFEEHLAVCPPCIDYIASYRATMELAREALEAPAETAGVPEELIEAILEARKE
jgi:anti-sigma factor RsiW